MALPTTALQLHLDASVNTKLWKVYDPASPYHNSPPAHGESPQVWEDADGKALALIGTSGTSGSIWVQTTPLMALPNIDMPTGAGSSYELWDTTGVTAKTLGTLISTTQFLVLAAIRIEGGGTNQTDAWLNDGLMSDSAFGGGGAYWGVHIRNNAGAYTILCYNYSGTTAAVVTLNASPNTNYVLVYWHTTGGSIFAELYDSTGIVASGNAVSGATANVAGQFTLGNCSGPAQYYNGKVGEVAIYNAYNATDRTTATDHFRGRWTGGGGGPGLPSFGTMTPNSAYVNATVPVKLVGVAFTGTGLDGTGGAFDAIAGFTFTNLVIGGSGTSGTVDIQIVAAKATGAYTFTYTTGGGSSIGTTTPGLTFTILSPSGGTAGDTGGNVRFNAGFN